MSSSIPTESAFLQEDNLDAVIPKYILEFVQESTKHFDESHDWHHAVKVTKNLLMILDELNNPYDKSFAVMAAMLHDVCDHKYPESIPRTDLEQFIFTHVEREKGYHMLEIIDNVSFSKQAKGLRKKLDEPYESYLSALADADRIEALGEQGIVRCETFTLNHGGKVPEDVVKHCHEKLLRLLPYGYIQTIPGKAMAEPLHQAIVDYVKLHS